MFKINQTKLSQLNETKIVSSFTEHISTHIQDRVDAYNIDNQVAFGSIHNMAIYLNDNTYTHYQFAVDIIAWNKLVWESFRATMLDVQSGTITLPTEEELIASLPVYNGVA